MGKYKRKHEWVFPEVIKSGKNQGKYKLIEFTSQTTFRLWPVAKISPRKPMLFDTYKEASNYAETH